MDCRAAPSRLVSLVLGSTSILGLLGTGCTQLPVQPAVPETALTAAIKADAEKELPKRPPQAATCVSYGSFYLKAAAEPAHSSVEREQLLDQARRSFQQALKLEPKSLDAHRGLARTYQERNEYDRAAQTYQDALKISAKDASLWFDLGMCQARQQNWAGALESMHRAAELDPENRAYGSALAYALARAGRYDESFALFKKLAGEGQAHYNVARMLHHVHQDEQSKQHLRLALQSEPGLDAARELLAQLEAPASGIRPAAGTDTAKPDSAGSGVRAASLSWEGAAP